jgi:predicted ATPase
MFTLKLNNYRSFKDQKFEFKRINILIGENSSGKSSLLKFFLILKQSLKNFRNSVITASGEEVDLGNFKDLIYYHEEDRNLEFSFKFSEQYYNFCNSFFKTEQESQDEMKLPFYEFKKYFNENFEIAIEVSKNVSSLSSLKIFFNNPILGNLAIIHPHSSDEDQQEIRKQAVNILYKNFERNKEYIIDNVGFDNNAFLNIISGADLSSRIKKKYPEEKNLFIEIAMFLLSQNYLENLIESISYVNPIKSTPERIFYKRDKRKFENSVDLTTLVNVLEDKGAYSLFSQNLIPIIKKFGIAEDIKIITNESLPVMELKAKIKDLWSNINDVGYGVAIQLPILLHSFILENSPKKHTIMIEQPEVHLHPRLQSNFIESLLSIGENNNYFIETHSEHILRKLQLIVKRNMYNVCSEDVIIYYFRRINGKSEISEHKITKDGKIVPSFPEGFYDNSYNLAKELL